MSFCIDQFCHSLLFSALGKYTRELCEKLHSSLRCFLLSNRYTLLPLIRDAVCIRQRINCPHIFQCKTGIRGGHGHIPCSRKHAAASPAAPGAEKLSSVCSETL